MRLLVGCLLLTTPIVLLRGAPAQACSCSSGYAVPLWPRDGATAVSLDAPLVVAATDLAGVTAQLVADDGTPVELVERGRLALGDLSCVNARYLFVAPAQPLPPNRSYLFRVTVDGAEHPTGIPAHLSFVTGTTLRDPAPRALPFHLFAAQYPSAQRLELFVEWDPSEPFFIGVHGEKADIAHEIFPGFAEQPAHVSFGAVDCADFTLVDVTGQTIASPHLCEPSKCAPTQSLGASSCGGEDFSPLSWADWQAVPDGCGAPAEDGVLGTATDTSPITDVARVDDAQASVAGGGCALQPAAPRRALQAPLLLAALALLWRASQRRAQKGGSAPDDPAAR